MRIAYYDKNKKPCVTEVPHVKCTGHYEISFNGLTVELYVPAHQIIDALVRDGYADIRKDIRMVN